MRRRSNEVLVKVHELIAELKKLPQDWEVVQASDPEGNDFYKSLDLGMGWYDQSGYAREFSSWIYEIDDPDERLERERRIEECNAVCLWP